MTDMKNPSVLIAECESALKDRFAALEAREERLTARVLDLFAKTRDNNELVYTVRMNRRI